MTAAVAMAMAAAVLVLRSLIVFGEGLTNLQNARCAGFNNQGQARK